MISTVSIDAPGGKINAILGMPDGAGPFPTIVVCHHRWGLDKFTESVVQRLNENGFIAGAPNFYHRRPAGEDSGEAMKYLDDDEIIADIRVTTAYFQKQISLETAILRSSMQDELQEMINRGAGVTKGAPPPAGKR